jgi:hypothetical protein
MMLELLEKTHPWCPIYLQSPHLSPWTALEVVDLLVSIQGDGT